MTNIEKTIGIMCSLCIIIALTFANSGIFQPKPKFQITPPQITLTAASIGPEESVTQTPSAVDPTPTPRRNQLASRPRITPTPTINLLPQSTNNTPTSVPPTAAPIANNETQSPQPTATPSPEPTTVPQQPQPTPTPENPNEPQPTGTPEIKPPFDDNPIAELLDTGIQLAQNLGL